LREILVILRARTGHDFTHYKRATVLRRIERRLQVNQQPDLPAYRDFLREHQEEARALLKDMLISVTNFFRDREAFDTLEREIIPRLFHGKTPDEQVRVWVPGCATGEEAYSTAMLLSEHAAGLANPPSLQVFATDIDEEMLARARRQLPELDPRRYFAYAAAQFLHAGERSLHRQEERAREGAVRRAQRAQRPALL
jgi:two-component system, chemotaxis family, CheB/CheR fusion protein